jgi:predicted ATPase
MRMHLNRVKISSFRNLQDFEIGFTRTAKGSGGTEREFRSHAIIGENGAGKSNLFEAIVTIFRDLDLNEVASLSYEMDYFIRGHSVKVAAAIGKHPKVTIDGKSREAWLLSDMHRKNPKTGVVERGSAREYLPSHIFTYYSGKNSRLESLFQQHQDRFIENVEEFEERRDSDAIMRRLFYCRHTHSKLVLLACLLAPEEPLQNLLKMLEIADVDSALFILKKPFRLSGELSPQDLAQGDKRFWYDQSRFSQEFLGRLWEVATAPIEFTEEQTIDFRGRTQEQELVYLFVKDRHDLLKLKEHIGASYRLFQYLEGSYVADLIQDLRVFVHRKSADRPLGFEQLSEGEMQLLTVLGLMRITREDHCLFLLDEPDTHLNPIWKLRYFDDIQDVLKQDDEATIKGDSQIIIATHDPLMIGSLFKEQVRILNCEDGRVTVKTPRENPQGMGVIGLLRSELFGLSSTLDRPTLEKLQRRNDLLAIRSKGELKPELEAELKRLRHYLEDLGFSHDSRDPLYERFIEMMYEVRSQPLDKLLSPKELKQQETLAKQIVTKIVKQEKTEELSDLARELSIAVQAKK